MMKTIQKLIRKSCLNIVSLHEIHINEHEIGSKSNLKKKMELDEDDVFVN